VLVFAESAAIDYDTGLANLIYQVVYQSNAKISSNIQILEDIPKQAFILKLYNKLVQKNRSVFIICKSQYQNA